MGMKCMRGVWSTLCTSLCSSFCIHVCRDVLAWSLSEVLVPTEEGGEDFYAILEVSLGELWCWGHRKVVAASSPGWDLGRMLSGMGGCSWAELPAPNGDQPPHSDLHSHDLQQLPSFQPLTHAVAAGRKI